MWDNENEGLCLRIAYVCVEQVTGDLWPLRSWHFYIIGEVKLLLRGGKKLPSNLLQITSK